MLRRVRTIGYKTLPPQVIGMAAALVARPKRSYAIFGEDIVLKRLLMEMHGDGPGFYVDIGAFHPSYGSNTKLLYDAGWRGLNIEADQHKIDVFHRLRRRDINVCAVISDAEGERDFYFHEGAKYASMAGLDREGVEVSARAMGRSISSRKVQTRTLASILAQHNVQQIDFLNIDIEGSEAEIIASTDWASVGTRLIGCEIRGKNLDDILASEAHHVLLAKGYSLAAWTPPTVFYRLASWVEKPYDSDQEKIDRVW